MPYTPTFMSTKLAIMSNVASFQLFCSPPAEEASTTQTYWRFKSNDMFDTLTLVIRVPDLGIIDTTLPTIRQLFKEIVDYANEGDI